MSMEGLVSGSTRVIPAINSIYSQSHRFKGALDPTIKPIVSVQMGNIFGIVSLKKAGWLSLLSIEWLANRCRETCTQPSNGAAAKCISPPINGKKRGAIRMNSSTLLSK